MPARIHAPSSHRDTNRQSGTAIHVPSQFPRPDDDTGETAFRSGPSPAISISPVGKDRIIRDSDDIRRISDSAAHLCRLSGQATAFTNAQGPASLPGPAPIQQFHYMVSFTLHHIPIRRKNPPAGKSSHPAGKKSGDGRSSALSGISWEMVPSSSREAKRRPLPACMSHHGT